MSRVLLFLSFYFIAVQQVFAAVSIPDSMKQTMKASADTPSLFNITASLLIVILLIYAVGLIYTKLAHINAKNIFKQPKKSELN